MARIAVIGTGYVGLCTGLAFAERGHDVTFVDVDASRLALVRAGKAPFFEPGIQELLVQLLPRVQTTTEVEAATRAAEFVFLCVGTPSTSTGSLDLRFIVSASERVGAGVRGAARPPIVVVKSTVLPGTAEDVVAPAIAKAGGVAEGVGFHVASNPEFLREGAALADARRPDRIVVGAASERIAQSVLSLYEGMAGERVVVTPRTAEMIKYSANALLAARVAFVNELANACERFGVDWYDVVRGVGSDPRIGPLFLRPGAGFGGSCFPKDVAALAHAAEHAGVDALLLRSVLAQNDRQPMEVIRMLREEVGELRGKRIALLGLAFKPETDDVRGTRALPIFRALVEAGADVVCHDPLAGATFRALAPEARMASSLEEALRDADAALIQTEWPEYAKAGPRAFLAHMRAPVVIDGRRTLDPRAAIEAGVRYRAIGFGARVQSGPFIRST